VCRRPVGKAPSQVSDYLDDSLPTRDRALLETHLGSCATLSPALYAALMEARDAMGLLRDSDAVISASVAQRIAEYGSS